MARYIVSRLAQFPLILAIIYLGTFFMVWVAPGDPFQQTERRLDPRVMDNYRRRLHAENWRTFLSHYTRRVFLHGDLGPSLKDQVETVNEKLAGALPNSLILGLAAMMLATAAGVTAGVIAAVRKGGVMDWAGLGISLAGISVPSFVVATVLVAVFAIALRWLPAGGLRSPGFDNLDLPGRAWDIIRHMILPVVSLSLLPMAYIARLMRVSMLDVLGSDYVRTARAKGLARPRVVWKHCLRNAFLPVLSFLGPATAATLTGSFVVEHLFNIRGMGDVFINAVRDRDATVLLGAVIVYSVLLLGLNLLVDILYVIVDPRIDLARKTA